MRVPPLEVLRAVHTDAVRPERDLAALHFEQNGPHEGLFVVEVLAVHVGSGKVMAVQSIEALIVGVPEDHVQNEFLGFAREGVQHRGEIHELIRASGLEQHGIDCRHAGNHNVIPPVGGVRTHQTDRQAVVVRPGRFRPEGRSRLVDGGRLDRQRLHRIVPDQDFILWLQWQAALHPFGQPVEPARQACQCAARGGGGHMQLQDADRWAELVRLVALQSFEIAFVPAGVLHRNDVVDFGRCKGAVGQGHRQRVQNTVIFAIAVAPDQRIKIADSVPKPCADTGCDGEDKGVAACGRDAHNIEVCVTVGDGDVEIFGRTQDFNENIRV